jgi:hypothetical protein
VPGLEHNGEHCLEFLIPKPAFERAFADFGGSKVIVPALIKERLAVAENPLKRKFQVKRQIGPDLRLRVYCIKGPILNHA